MTNTPTPEQVAEALKIELHIAPDQLADLVRRLRGEYRIPITDGFGPAGGEEPDNANEFVRQFPSAPIQKDAAIVIEALVADRDAQKARADAAELELHGPISDLTGADITNIIAHLSLELEPRGPLPTRNSVMMALIAAQNDLSAEKAKVARLVEALKNTAEQALAAEIPVGYGPEDKGQWTKGYDAAIRHARAAIAEVQE